MEKKSRITWFLTDSLGFERVPDVDVEVVVASEYQASRQGGGQRGHPAHDAAVLVGDELLVSSHVVHLAGGVIWSCYHCITVGEELEEIEVVRKRASLDRTCWELCTQWKRKSFFFSFVLTPMALMSLSWPPKVCLQVPSLMSHSLAVKSQAPEMKNLKSGDTPRDMQSPWCPANTVFWVPVSMSHSTLERQV